MSSIVPDQAEEPKSNEPELTPKPMGDVRPVVQGYGLGAQIAALVRYMARTEVHTYAFSVAANTILSLFPFIVLLLTISRNVFHSREMEEVVGDMMKNLLPVGQEFVMRNMQLLTHPHKGTQSLLGGHAAHHFHRRVSAVGGGAERRLGRPARTAVICTIRRYRWGSHLQSAYWLWRR